MDKRRDQSASERFQKRRLALVPLAVATIAGMIDAPHHIRPSVRGPRRCRPWPSQHVHGRGDSPDARAWVWLAFRIKLRRFGIVFRLWIEQKRPTPSQIIHDADNQCQEEGPRRAGRFRRGQSLLASVRILPALEAPYHLEASMFGWRIIMPIPDIAISDTSATVMPSWPSRAAYAEPACSPMSMES